MSVCGKHQTSDTLSNVSVHAGQSNKMASLVRRDVAIVRLSGQQLLFVETSEDLVVLKEQNTVTEPESQ